MNSPLSKTAVLAIFAALSSIVAAYFYPWPTDVVQSAIVGNPLFEPYDSSSVRQIRIMKFNDDRGGLDQILLRRKGEKWIVPAKKDFIASNAGQISLAASSLIESTVLEEVTDEQQAYLDYGVVDPDKYANTPNRSALGTKIILQDRDLKEIASLIIGTKVKDDPTNLQHFVRVPGQPTVYVIKFDERSLQTDFRSWIDPNLFELSDPAEVNKVVIEDYKIAPEQLATAAPQRNYRAEMKLRIRQNQVLVDLLSVKTPSGNDEWSNVELTPEMSGQFQSVGMQSAAIFFPDVVLKDKAAANALRTAKPDANDAVFAAMTSYGFLKTGFDNATFEFDSVGGQVSIETNDGVVITLYIGGIAEKTDGADVQLSYYVMLTAGVDESILPEPEEPADPDDKAYLRLVDERNQIIKSAQLRAAGLNQRFAPWYYVVTEDIINNIRPDVTFGTSTSQTTAPASNAPQSGDEQPAAVANPSDQKQD